MSIRPAPIALSIEVPVGVDAAWKAITDPDRIVEWFTNASPLGRPGDQYRLDFGDSAVSGAVVSVDPGHAFAYTWTWEGSEEGAKTLVSWTAESQPGGWPETTPDDTVRDDHLGYWEAYLEDLAELLAG